MLVLTLILIWCLIDCWRNEDDNNSWIVPSAGTRNMLTLVSSFNNFFSIILFAMGRFLDHFFQDRNFSGQEFVPIIMTLTEWQQKRCISQRSNNLYRLPCQSESFWIRKIMDPKYFWFVSFSSHENGVLLDRNFFWPRKQFCPQKVIWKAATV